jgi:hypothetical protein
MNTFLTVLNAYPAILASVQAVEAAIPLPKNGQRKLNLVLGAATTAWELGSVGTQINKTNWLAAVEAMTGITVAGLNAAGVFGTTRASVPATVPTATVSSN